jgi:hypothetical protein
MAGFNIPLCVCFKSGPPESVKEDAVSRIEALVAELVMCIANEHITDGGLGVELMSSARLASPKLSSCNEEPVSSIDKMC